MARVIDTEEKNIVGPQIRVLRIKKGITQKQLSDRLETQAVYVCRGSVSRLEAGERTVTDIELYGIAKVLGVTINDLFPE